MVTPSDPRDRPPPLPEGFGLPVTPPPLPPGFRADPILIRLGGTVAPAGRRSGGRASCWSFAVPTSPSTWR